MWKWKQRLSTEGHREQSDMWVLALCNQLDIVLAVLTDPKPHMCTRFYGTSLDQAESLPLVSQHLSLGIAPFVLLGPHCSNNVRHAELIVGRFHSVKALGLATGKQNRDSQKHMLSLTVGRIVQLFLTAFQWGFCCWTDSLMRIPNVRLWRKSLYWNPHRDSRSAP